MANDLVKNAAEILDPKHPLHAWFVQFCGKNEPSKRQARKFLSKYSQFKAPVKKTPLIKVPRRAA